MSHLHAALPAQGDLESCRLSEVPWEGGGGGERFYFENEQVGGRGGGSCLVGACAVVPPQLPASVWPPCQLWDAPQ
jgi:hypothetical protein